MTAVASPAGRIVEAVALVRERTAFVPDIGLILGTGLGRLAGDISVEAEIPYADIPGFPASTVTSHAGRLVLGTLAGRRVAALQGRWHRYEGYSLADVTFPVRVLRALGAGALIVSNACGGMRSEWSRGDLLLIADHINLMGDNPLVGLNDDSLGPRFPDMSAAYDPDLRILAREAAREAEVVLREGVYAAVVGPNLETAAEYRMLGVIGADAVGMSTVPEVIVARHAGLRVLGLGIITDLCLPDALEPVDLATIIAAAEGAEPALTAVVTGVLARMSV